MARDIQPLREIERVAQDLRSSREPRDRHQRRTRHQGAENGCDRDTGQPHEREQNQDLVQLVVDLGEWQRDQDRA